MTKLTRKQRREQVALEQEAQNKAFLRSRLDILEEAEQKKLEELRKTTSDNLEKTIRQALVGQELKDANGNVVGVRDENGVYRTTLTRYKREQLHNLRKEGLKRSQERNAPTNVSLGALTALQRLELKKQLEDPNLSQQEREGIELSLKHNQNYTWTCATTASSNMPRLTRLSELETTDENGNPRVYTGPTQFTNRKAAYTDKYGILNPGYFASNSDFRQNHRLYGYELVDDFNHSEDDGDQESFMQNAASGDLIQRWKGGKPTHLMTITPSETNEQGQRVHPITNEVLSDSTILVNDSSGYFTPVAIRKNKKYDITSNYNEGSSIYRFIGDTKDHEIMEENYNYLRKNGLI